MLRRRVVHPPASPPREKVWLSISLPSIPQVGALGREKKKGQAHVKGNPPSPLRSVRDVHASNFALLPSSIHLSIHSSFISPTKRPQKVSLSRLSREPNKKQKQVSSWSNVGDQKEGTGVEEEKKASQIRQFKEEVVLVRDRWTSPTARRMGEEGEGS
jgi:hypothetical protein